VAASRRSLERGSAAMAFGRMRWRGLAKAGLQIRFTAIVYNIKRCSRILAQAWRHRQKASEDPATSRPISQAADRLEKPAESSKTTTRAQVSMYAEGREQWLRINPRISGNNFNSTRQGS
jgi:hypothetical protein